MTVREGQVAGVEVAVPVLEVVAMAVSKTDKTSRASVRNHISVSEPRKTRSRHWQYDVRRES